MKWKPNARRTALTAYSMWAMYLGILTLLIPEAIFYAASIDTNPRLWWVLSLILLIGGAIGRLVDQGIDTDRLQSPWLIGVVVLIGAAVYLWPDLTTPTPEPAAPEAVAETTDGTPSEEAFLTVAVPLVAKWEGLRETAYLDPVGVLTICYGHTRTVQPGETRSRAECDRLLGAELLEYRTGLHRYFTAETRSRRLTPERDAAYGSLAYNVGIAGAGKSTATRRLNAGDIRGGCEAIGWWNKAGGRVLRGLVNRRAEEVALCMKGLAA